MERKFPKDTNITNRVIDIDQIKFLEKEAREVKKAENNGMKFPIISEKSIRNTVLAGIIVIASGVATMTHLCLNDQESKINTANNGISNFISLLIKEKSDNGR